MHHPVISAIVSGLLACVVVCGQSRHTAVVCELTAVNNVNDCYYLDSSTIGGLKFEDYKVTNPTAVQFDPAVRLKELAALGPATTAALCQTPPTLIGPPPTITFNNSNVVAQIYWRSGTPSEFIDVQFANFRASNGYTSPSFGFRMVRQENSAGTEVPQYQIQIQPGNRGLENVAGLAALGGSGVGYRIDPVLKTASFIGTAPSSELLGQAIYGVFAHAQSILNVAKFSITTPPPASQTLWTASEITSLAGQAEPWIAAAADATTPPGPPYKCGVVIDGVSSCLGEDEIAAFTKTLLRWGGEYLGLRTSQSFNVLVGNLRTWAAANAPAVDSSLTDCFAGYSFVMDIAKPLAMLWPTLRDDPALSFGDRQLIENWIVTRLVGPHPTTDFFPNDLGEYSDSVFMADAIRRSDHAVFAAGIQRYYGSLLQMRADGSFPLSARLSACSATYSDLDIAHLVSIAEMAATQGYDLYSLSLNGKTLDTAIKFLLDARDNPAILYQYSKVGAGTCFEGNPGDPPDFNAIFGPGNMGNLAWMEAYLARFPFSPTAGRLRKILGSNIAAAPFPLLTRYTGLNASCAFRKSYEFQPANGVKVAIVSGDGQTFSPDQPVLGPLSVRVTDNAGKALAGLLVSFAVTQGSANLSSPAQVLTDATGVASATVAVASGPVTVTATALGVSASFAMAVPGLAIYSGGIAGIAGNLPAVTTISQGSLFSIYGQNFAPAGTGRRVNPDELVEGVLPVTLLGVCVLVGGKTAPILDVYPGQINAVAPILTPYSVVAVSVTTGCGTPAAIQSMAQPVTFAPVSPEFLYFAHNANGLNPVAAVNAVSGAYVGPEELGSGFAPAHPGDLVTVFASGFGAPPIPGAPATAPAQIPGVTVKLGSVILNPEDVLYVGPVPGQLISQLNIRIPREIPTGNQPLQIRFNIPLLTSLPGAFLAIAAP